MPLTLPYPTSPQNGQTGDANVMFANQAAIVQAIQSFDGSQVQAGTIGAAAFNASINPNTLLRETEPNTVFSGGIVSIVSGLNITITGGTFYINGIRLTFIGVASAALTASKDTYIDVDYNGNVYYTAVANGAAAPALTALSVRIAKVITNATNATTVQQNGIDSINTVIYPQFLTKSAVDANGWTRRNFGNFVIYEITIPVTGVAVPAQSNAVINAGLSIPVGVADSSKLRWWCQALMGFGGRIYASVDNGNTSAAVQAFSVQLGNLTASSITVTGYIYIYGLGPA